MSTESKKVWVKEIYRSYDTRGLTGGGESIQYRDISTLNAEDRAKFENFEPVRVSHGGCATAGNETLIKKIYN